MGLALQDITGEAVLADGHATIMSFRAIGADGGSMDGFGDLSLDGSYEGALGLKLDQFTAVQRSDVTATISGEAALSRTAEGVDVTGDLVIDRADVRLDKLPSPGRPTLDVRFNDDDAAAAPENRAVSTLDISLTAPNQIFVEGNGLDAEFALDTQISGSLGDPSIIGAATIVRGDFNLANERFDFDRESRVDLSGAPQDAQINIVARRDNPDFSVIVTVTGTPLQPEVEISSEPELPKDEVLSRLLFGRSPAELSAVEAARLGAALASLANGGGVGILGNIENALPIDRLDLRETTDGAAQLTTGKYLARDVYLEVRSSTEGLPEVAVEWEPFNNLGVEVETEGETDQRLRVRWKRDFN